MKTYLATKNAGKLTEIVAMFEHSPLQLVTYPQYRDPEEGDTSYVDNALLKARALRDQLRAAGITDAAVLADDSGIEIDAFGGRPGVLSARYAGEATPWPQRRAHLLAQMHDKNARGARFVCVMAFIDPDGREVTVRGDVEGEIPTQECGELGFGYDSVFFYPPVGQTFAQIAEAQKNALSHRGRAASALLEALRA